MLSFRSMTVVFVLVAILLFGSSPLQAQPDCNGNGVPDNCDIFCGPAGAPCDIANCGASSDCNGNWIPDECDLSDCPPGDASCQDCNGNGIVDACEIPPPCPGCLAYPVQKLTASDGTAGANFGSVAMSGNSLVVGAYFATGVSCGRVYVFERSGNSWTEEARLGSPDVAAGDAFGGSVAVDSSRIVVGAPGADTSAGNNAGAVYVFRREGNGWFQEAKLAPLDSHANHWFGGQVGINGFDLVAATPSDADNTGVAYIFRYNGAEWVQEAKLIPSDAMGNDYFGVSVSIQTDTVVVGAPEQNHSGFFGAGSAYVFARVGGVWAEQAKLIASDATNGDRFGFSVSMSAAGDVVLIGARFGKGMEAHSGAAYVFRRNGSVWSEEAKLVARDGQFDDEFGNWVSLGPTVALIGAPRDDYYGAVDSGSAYVFRKNDGSWAPQAKLIAGDASSDDLFGWVAAMDNWAAIGAIGDDNNGGIDAGSLYVYAIGADCNANDIPDECDIDDGTSVDCNVNGTPDECECFAVEVPGAEVPAVAKNRYLSFVPGSAGCTTALRVTLTGAPPPFEASVGSQYWVGAPWRVTELSGSADSLPEPAFWAARLECTPHCDDWGQTGLIHVLDESVIPSAAYEIQAIACGCDFAEPGAYSAPLPVPTPRWGDIVGGNNDQPPNGVVDFNDIASVVGKFKNSPGAPIKSRGDVTPRGPDTIIDFNDVPSVVDAFRGLPYPYAGPDECP